MEMGNHGHKTDYMILNKIIMEMVNHGHKNNYMMLNKNRKLSHIHQISIIVDIMAFSIPCGLILIVLMFNLLVLFAVMEPFHSLVLLGVQRKIGQVRKPLDVMVVMMQSQWQVKMVVLYIKEIVGTIVSYPNHIQQLSKTEKKLLMDSTTEIISRKVISKTWKSIKIDMNA